MKWEIQVCAYLTDAADHIWVIQCTKGSDGRYVNLIQPTDPDELKDWNKSEHVAMGVIMVPASDLHLKLVHKMGEEPVWELWKVIEAQHQQHDASLQHEAWMQRFAIWKRPNEGYVDYYQWTEATCQKINCVTPPDLTAAQCSEEFGLFMIINSLDSDDPLRRQLISQKDVTLNNTYLSFLCTDRGEAIKTEAIELAHAALGTDCFLCQAPGHNARDCPHHEAVVSLIHHHNHKGKGKRGRGRSNGNWNGNWNGNSTGGGTNTQANAASSTTMPANDKPAYQEAAGVASASLSHDSCNADVWLCDSGASSSMSNTCSAFSSFRLD